MARSLTLPFARALPATASAASASTAIAPTFTASPALTATFTAAITLSAAAAAFRSARRLGRSAFRLGQECLARQPHLSALVALDELHAHAIALLDDILGLLGTSVLHL